MSQFEAAPLGGQRLVLIALFVALGGTAYAAVKLTPNQVKAVNIATQAVTNAKIEAAGRHLRENRERRVVNARPRRRPGDRREARQGSRHRARRSGKKAREPRGTIAAEAVTPARSATKRSTLGEDLDSSLWRSCSRTSPTSAKPAPPTAKTNKTRDRRLPGRQGSDRRRRPVTRRRTPKPSSADRLLPGRRARLGPAGRAGPRDRAGEPGELVGRGVRGLRRSSRYELTAHRGTEGPLRRALRLSGDARTRAIESAASPRPSGRPHDAREEPRNPRGEARLPARAARGGDPLGLRGGGREAAREGQADRPRADREAARPRHLRGARHLRPPPHLRLRDAEEPALGRRRRHRLRDDRRPHRLRLQPGLHRLRRLARRGDGGEDGARSWTWPPRSGRR